MKTVVGQVILLLLVRKKKDVAGYSSASITDSPVMKLWSRTRRLKFLLFHRVVHVSLEGTGKFHNLSTFVVQCRSL